MLTSRGRIVNNSNFYLPSIFSTEIKQSKFCHDEGNVGYDIMHRAWSIATT